MKLTKDEVDTDSRLDGDAKRRIRRILDYDDGATIDRVRRFLGEWIEKFAGEHLRDSCHFYSQGWTVEFDYLLRACESGDGR